MFRIVMEDNAWTGKQVDHSDLKAGQSAILFDGDTPIAEFSPLLEMKEIQAIVKRLNFGALTVEET